MYVESVESVTVDRDLDVIDDADLESDAEAALLFLDDMISAQLQMCYRTASRSLASRSPRFIVPYVEPWEF
eukprot:6846509-Pyramimonas_sp.AAC.2